jgi:hypothetical protein
VRNSIDFPNRKLLTLNLSEEGVRNFRGGALTKAELKRILRTGISSGDRQSTPAGLLRLPGGGRNRGDECGEGRTVLHERSGKQMKNGPLLKTAKPVILRIPQAGGDNPAQGETGNCYNYSYSK